MRRKPMGIICLCLILLIVCLCGCGGKEDNNSIIGAWTVTAYEINGEIVSKGDVSEYMGDYFAEIERPTLLFLESGHVRIYYDSGTEDEYSVNYTVTGDTIELYYKDEHFMYLEIDGDTIRMDEDSIPWIYTKE